MRCGTGQHNECPDAPAKFVIERFKSDHGEMRVNPNFASLRSGTEQAILEVRVQFDCSACLFVKMEHLADVGDLLHAAQAKIIDDYFAFCTNEATYAKSFELVRTARLSSEDLELVVGGLGWSFTNSKGLVLSLRILAHF